jgi:hypothetical protein
MAVVRVKQGARFEGFTRELCRILLVLVNVSENMLGLPSEVVVTAGSDGEHMEGSRHYTYQAIDVRSKTMTPDAKLAFRLALLRELGPNYLVLLEGAGGPNEHFHVQFKPAPGLPKPERV